MLDFQIPELALLGVYDAGVPNQERVVLQAKQSIDINLYGLMIGIRAGQGGAFPLRDNLVLLGGFGNWAINPGDWIFIYTAPGETRVSDLPNLPDKIYSFHWGKPQTIFQNGDLLPVLFRVGGVQIPQRALLPSAPP